MSVPPFLRILACITLSVAGALGGPWGCAHGRGTLQMDAMAVEGDLDLAKLNDEELFARGSAAFAAEEFKDAARLFNRLADFHPQSPHHTRAVFNAGLALEKLKRWQEARDRFAELADPAKGTGDALDASFRLAETEYQLGRFDAAATVLKQLNARTDLTLNQQLEAEVQEGVCQLEAGHPDQAEATLRHVVSRYQEAKTRESLDDYFPAQAQFFLGEVYRLHYETVALDPEKGTDALAHDLNYKAELLLSAQGHYLRSIRIGNGYWATAAGSRIGALYQDLYEHMVASPAPRELQGEEAQVYRQELRKRIRVLLSKAINVYERTLEAAERVGSNGPFIDRTRESLARMRELLLAEAQDETADSGTDADSSPPASEPQSGAALRRADLVGLR